MEEACMKDFRRSVFRLFLATFFLLFIAWIGMKAMQYHGDYERMIRDVQRFLRENDVVRFVRDKAVPFLRGKVIPAIGNVVNSVKGWFE
jgi:hypothetical protein